MPQRTIHDDVQAALKRLDAEDPGLKQMLKKAYGYAVFPSVGKAALVIGGAYGRGEVYERGKAVGYATIAQTTIGVQIGGDTFTEVLVFRNKEALDRFKGNKLAFAANASAVLVKAAAAGTADYEKGVAAYAYGQGGMLLEAAIGGQKFHFQPADEEGDEQGDEAGAGRTGSKAQGRNRQDEEEDDEGEAGEPGQGVLGSAAEGLKSAASKTAQLVKGHRLAATLIGTAMLAGTGLLLVRAMRKGADASEAEGSADDESDRESDQDDERGSAKDEYEDQAGDADEGDEGSEDRDDDDEDGGVDEAERSPRSGRSHARS